MWQSDHRRPYNGNVTVKSQAILWKCDSQIIEGHTMKMWQSDHRSLYYGNVTVRSQRAIIVYGKCDSSFREGYTMDMWQSYHRRPYCHSVELWQSDHRRTCYEKSISLLPEKASFAMKTYSCQITECVRFQKVQYIQITQEYQMKINLCIFIYSYRI